MMGSNLLRNRRVLLTGATGGIGRPLALQLASEGAALALVGSDAQRLQALVLELQETGCKVIGILADFTQPQAASSVVDAAIAGLGGIDMLINNAGLLDFIVFEHQGLERIADMIQVNVTAPIQLARCLVPELIQARSGHVVNIGSIFGSIGFPHYATYSATKYAMRGFSQALRRELADTGIDVTYVAPRAVDTPMNDDSSLALMRATNTRLDAPELVAALIIDAIKHRRHEVYIGQPESLFAWLNGLLPRVISSGIRKKTRMARGYANASNSRSKV